MEDMPVEPTVNRAARRTPPLAGACGAGCVSNVGCASITGCASGDSESVGVLEVSNSSGVAGEADASLEASLAAKLSDSGEMESLLAIFIDNRVAAATGCGYNCCVKIVF